MQIIDLNLARRLRTLRPLSPMEVRVLSRWYKRTPFRQVVNLRAQRGGSFYVVEGGRL